MNNSTADKLAASLEALMTSPPGNAEAWKAAQAALAEHRGAKPYTPTGRWVIYDEDTTRFARVLRNRNWQDAIYATKGAAKAALNRLAPQAESGKRWALAEEGYFHARIELWETKRNLIGGGEFRQPVNTPLCCDPSSETYHSM